MKTLVLTAAVLLTASAAHAQGFRHFGSRSSGYAQPYSQPYYHSFYQPSYGYGYGGGSLTSIHSGNVDFYNGSGALAPYSGTVIRSGNVSFYNMRGFSGTHIQSGNVGFYNMQPRRGWGW